jgi:GH25 family lysozyme M1 (1,4-beta-N-acetylmuramidase)
MKHGALLAGALALVFVSAVPAQAATADPASTPAATASATPDATAAPTPAPSPTADTTAAPAAPSGDASSEPNPSLAEMNAAGNHTMGSTVEAEEGAPITRFRSFAAAAPSAISVSGVLGQDVSGWQTNIDWNAQWAAGSRFAYVKASEGTDYTSSQFASQYNGSYNVGMIRGAYHFATPNSSDGATQARYFYQHGGGWAPDGRTLPPLLDIEYGTASGSTTCWGLDQGTMAQWIADFVTTLRSLTGVNPAIYSTTNWWNTCTGSNSTFGAYPLFIARYDTSTPGALPAS